MKIVRKISRIIKTGIKCLFSATERGLTCEGILSRMRRKRRFAKTWQFVDRQSGTDSLILLVAGFQEHYWDILMANINQANHGQRDVCVCIPLGGGKEKRLYEIAGRYGWSVLRIKDDLLSQAENTAIRLHPNANIIHKLDEDIVINDFYFDDMEAAFEHRDESEYCPGFLAPVININLATTDDYLKIIGKYDDFYLRFGKHHRGSLFFHRSIEVAEYLTKTLFCYGKVHALFDLARLEKRTYIACPVRFSIGAVLFTRQYWEELGYFAVGFRSVGRAEEETQMCSYNVDNYKPTVCVGNVVVGHLGYFTQKETCRRIFLDNSHLFMN